MSSPFSTVPSCIALHPWYAGPGGQLMDEIIENQDVNVLNAAKVFVVCDKCGGPRDEASAYL